MNGHGETGAHSREYWKRRVRETRRPIFAHAVGLPVGVELEPAVDPSRVDHVWILIEVPQVGRLRVAVNTLSWLNARAGFDPRVRLAIVPAAAAELPEPILEDHHALDYHTIEALFAVEYLLREHDPLEALLLERARRAVRVEVWGELYIRDHLGIHQLHSRRASCAVTTDFIGHDGALKLYYADHTAELLLLKFCGQA